PAEQLIARYAGRWAIEVAIFDAKNITGAGEARNRVPRAVERTVPFALFTQSIVIIWYHLAGHSPATARHRRDRAPWHATKTRPRLHRHDHQAAPGPDRRAISPGGGPPAHPRRNPRRPPGLGRGSSLIAKVERPMNRGESIIRSVFEPYKAEYPNGS